MDRMKNLMVETTPKILWRRHRTCFRNLKTVVMILIFLSTCFRLDFPKNNQALIDIRTRHREATNRHPMVQSNSNQQRLQTSILPHPQHRTQEASGEKEGEMSCCDGSGAAGQVETMHYFDRSMTVAALIV